MTGDERRPGCAKKAQRSPARALRYVDPKIVAELQKRVPAATAQSVQESLGISANTWKKIRDGAPIRRSVAERLLTRFHADHGSASARQDSGTPKDIR